MTQVHAPRWAPVLFNTDEKSKLHLHVYRYLPRYLDFGALLVPIGAEKLPKLRG